MIDRIKKLIEKHNLTAAQFAEEIGVQRSAVSHLLSGRNKPSLDFILKIKKRFPEVKLDWLLLGDGKMTETLQAASQKTENIQEELFSKKSEANSGNTSTSGFEEAEKPYHIVKSEDVPVYEKSGQSAGQSPKKLILLYPDDTFKIYNTQQ
jgi:transcriptional regulator with XRE-family HTH domain